MFKRIGKIVQSSRQLLQKTVSNYIVLAPQQKQVIFKPQLILLLCQEATKRVDLLKSLEPDSQEGLIAVVENKGIKVTINFVPESLFINNGEVAGELRLLKQPEIESNSIIFRVLIAGWKVFLGGSIPNKILPENINVENDKVSYKFPQSQLKLINVIFPKLQDGSSLNFDLKQGKLTIKSSIAVDWSNINLQDLIQIFNLIGIS